MKKENKKSGKEMKTKLVKALALSEILMFIVSSFAFAFIIGGMFVLNSSNVIAADQATTIVEGGPTSFSDQAPVQPPSFILAPAAKAPASKDITTITNTVGENQVVYINAGETIGDKTANVDFTPGVYRVVSSNKLVSTDGKTTITSTGTISQINNAITLSPSQVYLANNGGIVSINKGIATVKTPDGITQAGDSYVDNTNKQIVSFDARGNQISTAIKPITIETVKVNGNNIEGLKYSGITSTRGNALYKDGKWYTIPKGKADYELVNDPNEQVRLDSIKNSQAQNSLISPELAKDTQKLRDNGFTDATKPIDGKDVKGVEKGDTFVSNDGKVYTKDATTGALKEVSVATSGATWDSATYKTPFGDISAAKLGSWSPLLGNALEGVSWGAAILTLGTLVGNYITNANTRSLVNALTLGIAGGLAAGKIAYGISEQIGKSNYGITTPGANPYSSWAGYGVGITVGYLIVASQYTKTKTIERTLEFKCYSWVAPTGGADCTKCNGDPLRPCSEYRCKALGQTCKLLNAGTGKERCINSAPNDVTSPGIKPWKQALTEGYTYEEVKERPPGQGQASSGMTIKYNGGCLRAFYPFQFGIVTTEKGSSGTNTITQPAQCKIDFNHTAKFDEMEYWMGEDNLFVENHTQAMSLPGTNLMNSTFPELKNGGDYVMYIRCRDGNGNENRDEFAVRFCIDKTPDLTAPEIKRTDPIAGSPVLYKVDNVSANFFTNEPVSGCRWERKDADYSNMKNNMSCSNNVWEMNAEFLYTCTTTITGVKDMFENQFYVRCRDLAGNTMQQSYEYDLIGTQPLTIIKTGPTGIVGAPTSTVTAELSVKTDNGYNNGASTCYYSPTGADNSYIAMAESGGNEHLQSLDLTEGVYTYYYKCIDLGGNSVNSNTTFTIYSDKYSPEIVRTYAFEGKLLIFTDEESKCSYSTESCNFRVDEGINMPYDFEPLKVHVSEWKQDQTYYIKCSDKYDNVPNPSECSAIIKPYQLPEEE